MSLKDKLFTGVVLLSVLMQISLCQSTSKKEAVPCALYSILAGFDCGRCVTVQNEIFYDGNTKTLVRATCSECSNSQPSGSVEIKPPEELPKGYSFDKLCASKTEIWVWAAIGGGILLILGITLFVFREKLPCCAKKDSSNYNNDSLNQNTDTTHGIRN